MRVCRILSFVVAAGACHHDPYVGTAQPTTVYAEPAALTYERVTVEHVVSVVREALTEQGYTVAKVSSDSLSQIVWAKRGNDEVLRVFVTPQGRRLAIRSMRELRGKNPDEWERREPPAEVIKAIDRRMGEGH